MIPKKTNARVGGSGVLKMKRSQQKELASNSQLESRKQAPVRGELFGSTVCISGGIRIECATPVLALCRQLLANGLDVDRALEVYRRGVLALRVRSITEAAGLEINGKGTDFVPRSVGTASPMRLEGYGISEAANGFGDRLTDIVGIPSFGKR